MGERRESRELGESGELRELRELGGGRLEILYERVRAIDPELVSAAAEQDGELIREYLKLSPRERLRRGVRAGRALGRLRDARRPG